MNRERINHAPANPISKELKLFWLFIRRDLIVTICSASIFMAVASLQSPSANPEYFLLGVLYFSLYIYPFNILNQLHGIEEDKINKPDRPLPRNLISIQEAWNRYFFLTLLYLLLGYYLGVFLWTVLWVVVTYFLNAGGWDKQWFTKNVVAMGLGTFAQLGAAWSITGHIDSHAFLWILTISIWVGITSPLQDFRDQTGDAINNRTTLPILLGDNLARKVMAGIWMCSAILVVLVLFILNSGNFTISLYIIATSIGLWHLFIINRLLTLRTSIKDASTYRYHCLLYCFLLISSFCIL